MLLSNDVWCNYFSAELELNQAMQTPSEQFYPTGITGTGQFFHNEAQPNIFGILTKLYDVKYFETSL